MICCDESAPRAHQEDGKITAAEIDEWNTQCVLSKPVAVTAPNLSFMVRKGSAIKLKQQTNTHTYHILQIWQMNQAKDGSMAAHVVSRGGRENLCHQRNIILQPLEPCRMELRTYCLSDVMPGCKIHLSSKPSEERIRCSTPIYALIS